MLFNTKNPVRAGLHETGPCLSSNRGICTFGIPYLIATRLYPAGVNPFTVMAGLLTRPSRRAFPVLAPVAGCDGLMGTHSSGYCPGFPPGSLFIRSGEPSGTISDCKITIIFQIFDIYFIKLYLSSRIIRLFSL